MTLEPAQVATVRRFNRLVTERVGALRDEYLSRARSLGASRVLWEIGCDGSDARTLRRTLDLDSGYLSRLLRSLEREGLVTVRPDPEDGRIRTIELTASGVQERALLDAESDALAGSLLGPLTDRQRARLTDAMDVVERLLTASMVTTTIDDPTTRDAQYCIARYFAELDERFDAGFDPASSISADADELTEPRGLLLIARLRGDPIGCGALKLHHDQPADIKRMWVDGDARGLGLGRRILAELEAHAARRSVGVVRLETNRALDEAINLYRSAGYEEVAAFNDEPFAHHWFEKRLEPRLDRDPTG